MTNYSDFMKKTQETGVRVLGNRGLEKLALAGSALGAGAAYADPVVNVNFGQGASGSAATFYFRNDDSITYDSAQLKFNEVLTPVAQAVKDNNSDYASMSLDNIMGLWDVRIRAPPTGEVKNGWNGSLSNGNLDLSHISGIPNLSYTVWNNTTDNASQNEMAVTVDFFDQLDFNNNGQYDAFSEQLAQVETTVQDGFTVYEGGTFGQSSSTNVQAIGVIPEPAALGLVLLGGAFMLKLRRMLTPGYK